MGEVSDVSRWASQALSRWDAQLNARATEIAELRAAGVPIQSVELLYPITDMYNEALLDRFADVATAREAAKIFATTKSAASKFIPLLSPGHKDQYSRLWRRSTEGWLARASFSSTGKDPWTSEFYMGMLIQGLYSTPMLLICLSGEEAGDAAEAELLLTIEAADFLGFQESIEAFLQLLEAT